MNYLMSHEESRIFLRDKDVFTDEEVELEDGTQAWKIWYTDDWGRYQYVLVDMG
jgi:hypothetical protein